ncbi:hypothetical protein CIG75_16020 [Tumebacillus algifaecis]|uniref:CYTH domain-containing protein n=1 Tax=Tumebacillus algifaecis TaxID=1214604 RepID=A0A223D4M2_9BACL|nr:CYTH domain-containing protein [Tumebacillus algifaecis]ASS76304.1 hypothetical protein CIG75_16020 [Tumebacillus algifaecis]
MSIETEVKFRTEQAAWQQIKEEFGHTYQLDHIEEQTNQYYNTTDGELDRLKIGLRLRQVKGRSIVNIKRDTKESHKRVEIEETYEGTLDTLPKDSPILNDLLQEIDRTYEEVVPHVAMRTKRYVYLIEEQTVKIEVCFDEVLITGNGRDYPLYEIEFELVSGEENRLLQLTDAFRVQHGSRVEQSSVSKLAYALHLVRE